jgi:hypothetical protein
VTPTVNDVAHRRTRLALAACLLLLVACVNRAPERPREGAAPVIGGTPVRIEGGGAPPTLAVSSAFQPTPTPLSFATPGAATSPGPLIAASPAASPGQYPVISSLLPAPGATLPPGDIVIGARITGSSDLTDIIAYVDGEAIQIPVGGPSARLKVVNLVRTLAVGSHEVRIQARDQHGQLGGYRWQFTVTPGGRAGADPTPRPTLGELPTRTPLPVPTRRSIITPLPTITPRTGSH